VLGRNRSPAGFFDRLADEFTERECEVFRFTCPTDWDGGEPCECTEPNGLYERSND